MGGHAKVRKTPIAPQKLKEYLKEAKEVRLPDKGPQWTLPAFNSTEMRVSLTQEEADEVLVGVMTGEVTVEQILAYLAHQFEELATAAVERCPYPYRLLSAALRKLVVRESVARVVSYLKKSRAQAFL